MFTLVSISIAASISAMMIAGPRVYFAMARDGVFAARAGHIHPRFRAPVRAVLAQAMWSGVLVLSGTLSDLVSYTGFAVVLFSRSQWRPVFVRRLAPRRAPEAVSRVGVSMGARGLHRRQPGDRGERDLWNRNRREHCLGSAAGLRIAGRGADVLVDAARAHAGLQRAGRSRRAFLDTRIPIESKIDVHSDDDSSVRHRDRAVLAGDGQVTFGQTVVKGGARKIRRLYNDRILAGFAGSAADSFALFGRFESKLEQYRGNLERSAVELAKDWRSDRILRRLEAMLVVLDKTSTFLLSGNGDLIEPDDGVVAIGSGGPYALAAAKALAKNTELDARTIAEKAMAIAGEICIYTNASISVEEL